MMPRAEGRPSQATLHIAIHHEGFSGTGCLNSREVDVHVYALTVRDGRGVYYKVVGTK